MAVLYIPNYNEVNDFVEDGRARNKTLGFTLLMSQLFPSNKRWFL